jgi:hypothetical protein
MAVKKKPADSGKQMQKWDEELAKRAAIAQETAESQAMGSKKISLRGGAFSIGGDEIDTEELQCIVLDSCAEKNWFKEKYDPDNIVPPDCYAINRNAKLLAPVPEDVKDLQNDICKTCQWNQWNSADTGKGKACKDKNRLMLITPDDLENIDEAEPHMLTVPTTSGKAWNDLVKKITVLKKPPLAFIIGIKIKRHPDYQFVLQFRIIGDVDEQYIGDLLAKADGVVGDMMAPYTYAEEDDSAKKPSKATQRRGSGQGAPAGRKGSAKASEQAPAGRRAAPRRARA